MIEKEPRNWTTGMLAREKKVSPRQIQEDINLHIERGIRIKRAGWKLFIDKD
jgi:predicted DNA-binding transcriptional regulator YafY